MNTDTAPRRAWRLIAGLRLALAGVIGAVGGLVLLVDRGQGRALVREALAELVRAGEAWDRAGDEPVEDEGQGDGSA